MLPLVTLISVAAVSVSALPSPQGGNSSATQPVTTATITNACAQVSQATESFLASSPTGELVRSPGRCPPYGVLTCHPSDTKRCRYSRVPVSPVGPQQTRPCTKTYHKPKSLRRLAKHISMAKGTAPILHAPCSRHTSWS
jgi:hypothetical protein